jgi:hypothetical protein
MSPRRFLQDFASGWKTGAWECRSQKDWTTLKGALTAGFAGLAPNPTNLPAPTRQVRYFTV